MKRFNLEELMDELKAVLNTVIHDLMKQQKDVDFQKVLFAWERAVGPKASSHTKITYLTKDKIRVNVDSSAWLYDLNLRKERILKEVQKTFDVKDLKMRLGSVKD